MTEVKCGKLTALDLIRRRYVLETDRDVQYYLIGNDERLSLFDNDQERGQITLRQNSSGLILIEKNGEYETIGEYQKVEDKYRILPYENFAAIDSWREDFHPLDYL